VSGCTLGLTDLGAPPTGSPTGFRTALRITIVGSATGWISQLGGASALDGFVAGQVVSCVAWMRKSSGTARTCNIRITWYTSGGTTVGSDVNGTGVSITGTTWQKLTIDAAVVPATATRCNIQILVASGTNGEIFDVAGVGIMKGQQIGVFAPPFVCQNLTGGPATTEVGAVAGARWSRTDVPKQAGARDYVCHVGGLPKDQLWGSIDASSLYRLETDVVNSTTTQVTVPPFAVLVDASAMLYLEYELLITGNVIGTGWTIGFSGPTIGAGFFFATCEYQTSATAWTIVTIQAYGNFPFVTAGVYVATPSIVRMRIKAQLTNGATGGTVDLLWASEIAANAATIKRGSVLTVT
jgi:hypothetical protein